MALIARVVGDIYFEDAKWQVRAPDITLKVRRISSGFVPRQSYRILADND